MRRQLFFSVLALVVLSVLPASAQSSVGAGDKLGWDQAAPSLAAAQGYEYAAYIDSGARVVLTGVTCTGTAAPFTCTVAFPASTPGTHQIALTAATTINGNLAESVKSAPLPFVLVLAPDAPASLRIIHPSGE